MDHAETTPEAERALEAFRSMVTSVGVKRFAGSLGLSTRQVNRILSGVQPNPVDRLLRSLQSCDPDIGDRVLDYICTEMGGYFIREEGDLDQSAINAVRECAEAIAAISDNKISPVDEREIREAIAALVALHNAVTEQRKQSGNTGDIELKVSVAENAFRPAAQR